MAMDIKRTSWSGGWATLRDLEIIQTVIDHGSVTNAAERLGISQPAVSQTLNQIEKRCGKKLFIRENNKLVPNSDALLLYEEITNIADSFNRLSHFHRQEKTKLTYFSSSNVSLWIYKSSHGSFYQKIPN